MREQNRNLRYNGRICLALGLITLALYLSATRHGFIQYDDQQYVTENLHVQAGLTGHGLVWAFGDRAGAKQKKKGGRSRPSLEGY